MEKEEPEHDPTSARGGMATLGRGSKVYSRGAEFHEATVSNLHPLGDTDRRPAPAKRPRGMPVRIPPRQESDALRDWGIGTGDRDRDTALICALTLVFDAIGTRP